MKERTEVMIGNHAIARGLVEAGVELAAAYPGTPSSEILPGIVRFGRETQKHVYAEWSTNERCAFEVAFGAALHGARAVCVMKQVGLNVAFPALLDGRSKSLKGGLVIVSCDDPGPQSSQTEQDTRLLAVLFGIPVFDPATPGEAGDAAYHALTYSFEHKKPVILRSTHRVSHAREEVTLYPAGERKPVLAEGIQMGRGTGLGIVASGMSCSLAFDVLSGMNVEDKVSLYKAAKIFPPEPSFAEFVKRMDRVLFLEETDAVLERLAGRLGGVWGRRNGFVPREGELTYDVVRKVIEQALLQSGLMEEERAGEEDDQVRDALKAVSFKARPPRLCAGCSHRASFFAMKQAFPDALFPGDIGCYTLGISMGAVDTCLDMGGGVNLAAGFHDAFTQDGTLVPVIASVGDSTFFHACLPSLYDAVAKKKKFILVIMDNSTTAMTGMQPTPQSGMRADGTGGRSIVIEDMIDSFGTGFMRILDPYDVPLMMGTLKEAYGFLSEGGNSPAVIIARRECLLLSRGKTETAFDARTFEENCTGCGTCTDSFDCPALLYDGGDGRIKVDESLCSGCGTCIYVCPFQDTEPWSADKG